jgi:hypothetical protein
MDPEPADLGADLGHAAVREEEPGAEDALGEDVEDGEGDDLGVDADGAARARHDAPDDRVGRPDEDGVARDHGVEARELAASVEDGLAALAHQGVDDGQVGNACNGIPESN